MSINPNLSTYYDVQTVLDASLKAGGGVYTLPTPNGAKHWRRRAYSLRRLLHKRQAAALRLAPEIAQTSTPYDQMVFALIDGHPDKVRISLLAAQGTFTPDEGAAINFSVDPKPTPPAFDPNNPLDLRPDTRTIEQRIADAAAALDDE